MHKNNILRGFIMVLLFLCNSLPAQTGVVIKDFSSVTTGAQQFSTYLPVLKGKRVGVITNTTGRFANNVSIVDTLLKLKVNVTKVFGPEHGFRGNVAAGETVNSGIDEATGLPVVSLYGNNKKPAKEQLADIDILVYDIQDLGVRFYTYISTMCYAMEACAENNKEFMVLDRPNPNGFYIDGPILEEKYKSFLGLHHVPIVYGMTCGEYAQMANGEGWLKNKVKCRLTVITLKNYDRNASYSLPINPSPNIPTATAVLLYPSLGLFEGSMVSLGRGTDLPFQVIGFPTYPDTAFAFTPQANTVTKDPKYLDKRCYGLDLREAVYIKDHPHRITLGWLQLMYLKSFRDKAFFEANFNYHVGNSQLQEQIKAGTPEDEIRKSWKPGLDKFKKMRKKYLLYPDFK